MSREDHRRYDEMLERLRAVESQQGANSRQRADRFARIFTFVGIALACGSWGYFVLAPKPSFLFGSFLLGISAVFLGLAIWEWFTSRALRLVLIFVVLSAFSGSLMWAHTQLISKQWEDVASNLHLAVSPLEIGPNFTSGNNFLSVVSITSESQYDIVLRNLACGINGLLYANGSGVKGMTGGGWNSQLNQKLGKKGNTTSVTCYANFWRLTDRPICADIFIGVTYSLESQANKSEEKTERFVGRLEEGKIVWYKEPPRANADNSDYCH